MPPPAGFRFTLPPPLEADNVTVAPSTGDPDSSTTIALTFIGKPAFCKKPSAGSVRMVSGTTLRGVASKSASMECFTLPTNNFTDNVTGWAPLVAAGLNVTVPEYDPLNSAWLATAIFTVADPLPDAGLTDNQAPPD